nr:hypothetical protein Iba_chr01eCG7860 [Ipomoea batatas]
MTFSDDDVEDQGEEDRTLAGKGAHWDTDCICLRKVEEQSGIPNLENGPYWLYRMLFTGLAFAIGYQINEAQTFRSATEMYLATSAQHLSLSASSSGISMENSCSKAITSSTLSKLSRLKSFWKSALSVTCKMIGI